ncbi:MAG: hypothetical protein OHK0031_01060 [Anaerolineales bacterium]
MEKRPGDDLLCFLCDYPWLALIFVLLVLFALIRLRPVSAPAEPALSQTPASAAVTPLSVSPLPSLTVRAPAGQIPPSAQPTLVGQPSSTPSVPTFTLAFIAVNWRGNLADFRLSAQAQAQTFAAEAGLENFLRLNVIAADAAMTDQDLTDPALVDLVLAFAREQGIRADRYVGLTNADLAPEGMSGVVGWTSGGSGLMVETQDPYVTAHELGHTFGLCDEYNYADWSRQNSEYAGGCPNPYPAFCDQALAGGVNCDGTPADDGANSIMGPAGLLGDYSYNRNCLTHLQQKFAELAR